MLLDDTEDLAGKSRSGKLEMLRESEVQFVIVTGTDQRVPIVGI